MTHGPRKPTRHNLNGEDGKTTPCQISATFPCSDPPRYWSERGYLCVCSVLVTVDLMRVSSPEVLPCFPPFPSPPHHTHSLGPLNSDSFRTTPFPLPFPPMPLGSPNSFPKTSFHNHRHSCRECVCGCLSGEDHRSHYTQDSAWTWPHLIPLFGVHCHDVHKFQCFFSSPPEE